MRIVFICGSLEPGRDGVGDYTRRLAVELIKQGHQVTAIALNDQQASEIISVTQSQDGTTIKVLRLPATLKSKIRFEHAKRWISEINPDLLSLQFVLFAFHPKGLSFQLHQQLRSLGKGRKWHIMFHELWVGMDKKSSLKEILWEGMQRLLIWQLIKVIKPVCVHTQAKFYQIQLAALGIDALYLPLFSNIPKCNNNSHHQKSNSTDIHKEQREVSLVLFGGVHPQAPVKQFVEEIAMYAKRNNITPVLKIIGRYSVEQERWARLWQSAGLSVEMLGEQPEQYISEILSTSSLGISTNPLGLADKSGTISAMREHNLPVLCVSHPWYPRKQINYEIPDGVTNYKKGNFSIAIPEKENPVCKSVSDISRQFIKSVF